jgi:RNA-splicing ligase RtcB|tara:strand:+ start:361 stop:783 length:423 start_codon:yes stop_codon:yes gene_type:complete
MKKQVMQISDESRVQMPMKTVASLIVIVALGCMGYFQIVENLNQHQTRLQLMESDLEKNTEFRIKWPRGQLGSLPADSEQFMLIENLYKDIEKIKKQLEDGMHNKVNIQFLQKQMDKVLVDIEKLKDANREMKYTNGKHQ